MSITKGEQMIDIHYLGSIVDETSEKAQAIMEIIIACDKDFVPPLSLRESISRDLSAQTLHKCDFKPYWSQILQQQNIVALNENGKIVAFMSFKYKYSHVENFVGIVKDGDTINYISTICVLHDYRRLHITSRFYDMMEENLPREVQGECVATRTWSTNESHIRLLNNRGYALTHTILGDRISETGKKLDTVYFCKRLELATN